MSAPADSEAGARPAPLPRRAAGSGIEWLGLALAIAAALAPFCFAAYPPLHDYPFHLARIRILQSLGSGDYLDQIYQFNTWLLPNVAMDLVLHGLRRLVDDVVVGGKLFVCAVQLLTVGGVCFLRWTLQGRLGLAPLLAAVVAHNWVFLFGFLNYLFGVALFLWCLAIWIRQMYDTSAPRLLVGAVSAALLFFCHFLAFGLFALAVAALELQHALETRATARAAALRLCASALPLIPPLVAFVLLTPTAGQGGTDPFGDWLRALNFRSKPWDLTQSLLSGSFEIDVATAIAALLTAVGAIVALGRQGARLRFDRRLLLPLAALLVLPLAAPSNLFSAFFIDYRLLLPFVYLAIGTIGVDLPQRAWRRVLGAGVAIVVAARAAAFCAVWWSHDRIIDAYLKAYLDLPAPATLYVAYGEASPVLRARHRMWSERWNPPLKHVVSLASLAGPVYVPATWAHPAQQPVVVRDRYQASYRLQGQNPIEVSRAGALSSLIERIRAVDRAGGHPPGPVLLLLLYPEAIEEFDAHAARVAAAGPQFAVLGIEVDRSR